MKTVKLFTKVNEYILKSFEIFLQTSLLCCSSNFDGHKSFQLVKKNFNIKFVNFLNIFCDKSNSRAFNYKRIYPIYFPCYVINKTID